MKPRSAILGGGEVHGNVCWLIAYYAVIEWLLANGLQLNVKKTKYMLFHKQNKIINKLNLRINNNIINETDKLNFL